VRDKAGYKLKDHALGDAAWYLEDFFAMGCLGSNHKGLYAWESLTPESNMLPAVKTDTSNPAAVTKKIKWAARFFGVEEFCK
jgi:hypothetical protein